MPWVFDDGGRTAAGFRGEAGDCVTRAVAIVTGTAYQQVYDAVNAAGRTERLGSRHRTRSNARTGVNKPTTRQLFAELGWLWTPTMSIGSGCRVHLRVDELPTTGALVVSVTKHVAAVIDGVLHDTHDCSRDGTRCVYGYWRAP